MRSVATGLVLSLTVALGAAEARAVGVTYYVIPSDVTLAADFQGSPGNLRAFVPAPAGATNTVGGSIEVDFDPVTRTMQFTGGGITFADLDDDLPGTPTFPPGVNGSNGRLGASIPVRIEGNTRFDIPVTGGFTVNAALNNVSIDAAVRNGMLIPFTRQPLAVDPTTGTFALDPIRFAAGTSRLDLRGTWDVDGGRGINGGLVRTAVEALALAARIALSNDPNAQNILITTSTPIVGTEISVSVSGGYNLVDEDFAAGAAIGGNGTVTAIDFDHPGILTGPSYLTFPVTVSDSFSVNLAGVTINGTWSTTGTITAFAIPEPGTFLLTGLGLAALAGASRRRGRC